MNLYVIKGEQLAKRDLFSESDPYLKITHGSKVLLDDRDNYQMD
jgi:hypothetical protein